MHPYGLEDADDYARGAPDKLRLYEYAASWETLLAWTIDEINTHEAETANHLARQGDQLATAGK